MFLVYFIKWVVEVKKKEGGGRPLINKKRSNGHGLLGTVKFVDTQAAPAVFV